MPFINLFDTGKSSETCSSLFYISLSKAERYPSTTDTNTWKRRLSGWECLSGNHNDDSLGLSTHITSQAPLQMPVTPAPGDRRFQSSWEVGNPRLQRHPCCKEEVENERRGDMMCLRASTHTHKHTGTHMSIHTHTYGHVHIHTGIYTGK